MRHVIIATLRRGAVSPPQPLDAQNQRMVDAVIQYEAARAEQEGATQMSRWRAASNAKKAARGEYIEASAQRVLMKAMGR